MKLQLGLHSVLHILFLLVLSSVLLIGCAKSDVAIEPISPNKAARNLELRDKYETLLFNHLIARGELPMKNRFESIQKMAKEGFKPADLALALYDIEHTDLKTDDSKAEKDLDRLAESGDVTAQCLYSFYWKPEDKPKRWHQYVTNSANAGVAKCMFLRARYVEKDKSKEQLDWTYKAAVKGDSSGQSLMAFAYYRGEVVPKNMDRSICWAIELKKSGSHFDEGIYQNLMFSYMQEKQDLKANPPNEQFCESAIKTYP
jgi:TPR repeat protein